MPGPPPNPNAIRRNLRPDWVTLPASGCALPVPPWPATMKKPTKAQQALWDELWVTPQAVMWHDGGWFRTIARYAILVIRAESTEKVASTFMAEVRQMEDRLGLTPMAMKRLQWEVGNNDGQGATGDGGDDGEPKPRPAVEGPPNLELLVGDKTG